jgi:transcription antitermination factor NusG
MENWYVLYTAPRAEKKVALRLQECGAEVFLPLHLSPRKWSDRVKMVETPLFSSYLFVYSKREKLYDFLKTAGLARIIYFEGQPATLRNSEIESIKKFLTLAVGKNCRFEVDEELKILYGPLRDKVGKVKILKGKYAVLILEKTGLQVMVETEKLQKK